jgi:hypothetical protein
MKKDICTLTKEEQEIEDAIARSEYVSIENLEEEKVRYAAIAEATLSKYAPWCASFGA